MREITVVIPCQYTTADGECLESRDATVVIEGGGPRVTELSRCRNEYHAFPTREELARMHAMAIEAAMAQVEVPVADL